MWKRILIGLPFLLHAQSSFEFTGRYWFTRMGSRIRVEQNGFGTDIDARRDLGMPDKNFPQGGFLWRRGRSLLRFEYTPIDYAGDRTVTRTILFHGQPFTVGTRVVSELEVQHLQLSWAYQFVNVHDGVFRIGPMVEADGFLMRGSLGAPDLAAPFRETENLSAGLPTAGLAMEIQPHPAIDIYGQAAGMQAGSYGYFVGSDSGVRVRAWKYAIVTAGYRTFNLHVENSPDFAHLRLRGPFVGAGFRF
jgi:hypothetical protein